MQRKKVDVADLKPGMYVAELDRPWLETPFLFQGFTLRTKREILALQQTCDYVYIDIEQSIDSKKEAAGKLPSGSDIRQAPKVETKFKTSEPELVERVPFQTEVKVAARVYHQAKDYVKQMWEDARLGKSIDPEGARQLASSMVDSIMRNENALVWLTQLKHRDEYTSQHSLNVSVFSILFGRHLGLNKAQLKLLGFGALLHDIGKMRIPLEILNKPGRPTPEEMELLKKHPEYGKEILAEKQSDLPPVVFDIAYSHHERYDGSGYPLGLSGNEISRFTYIVSIVDVYDAVTSDRCYHMGISPHEALNLMYGLKPKSFHPDLVEEFIRCLGIYPVGSVVELESGEVGVVMSVNRKRSLFPNLALVLDKFKKPLPVYKMLNLDLLNREEGITMKIKKILKSDAYGIDPHLVIRESTGAILATA